MTLKLLVVIALLGTNLLAMTGSKPPRWPGSRLRINRPQLHDRVGDSTSTSAVVDPVLPAQQVPALLVAPKDEASADQVVSGQPMQKPEDGGTRSKRVVIQEPSYDTAVPAKIFCLPQRPAAYGRDIVELNGDLAWCELADEAVDALYLACGARYPLVTIDKIAHAVRQMCAHHFVQERENGRKNCIHRAVCLPWRDDTEFGRWLGFNQAQAAACGLEAGIIVQIANAHDARGRAPLYYAISYGYSEKVNALLNVGAELEMACLAHQGSLGWALVLAITSEDIRSIEARRALVSCLISRFGQTVWTLGESDVFELYHDDIEMLLGHEQLSKCLKAYADSLVEGVASSLKELHVGDAGRG